MDKTGSVVRVSALVPGDHITETTSPAGPWYEVVRADATTGVLVVDARDGLVVDIPVAGPGSVVLRRGS